MHLKMGRGAKKSLQVSRKYEVKFDIVSSCSCLLFWFGYFNEFLNLEVRISELD